VLRFLPALNISAEQVQEGLDILRDVLLNYSAP
jgi:4-aminobutyrate aminotransferase-like enzyme